MQIPECYRLSSQVIDRVFFDEATHRQDLFKKTKFDFWKNSVICGLKNKNFHAHNSTVEDFLFGIPVITDYGDLKFLYIVRLILIDWVFCIFLNFFAYS